MLTKPNRSSENSKRYDFDNANTFENRKKRMKKKNSNKYDKKFDRQNFYDNEKSDRINNNLRKKQ